MKNQPINELAIQQKFVQTLTEALNNEKYTQKRKERNIAKMK